MAGTRNFKIVSQFNGYHHREDITNLPPGILIPGSKNVLTDVAERISIRKGYTLDGEAGSGVNPILGSFDWFTHLGYERNLRSHGTVLQYRYVDGDGNVTWRDLVTGTASPKFNFTTFWDSTQLIEVLLYVNGQSEVNEWSGAITTIASNTATTITKEGATTWAQEGFYTAGTRQITIDGTAYTYTGGENTTTLTGLSGLPAFSTGEVIHQTPVVTANSAITSMNASFANDLIATRNNHVYYGSLTSSQVYLSAINNYKDVSFSSPRLVGEGGLFVLDSPAVGFIVQDEDMYVTAGKDLWYRSEFVQTTSSVVLSGIEVTTIYEAFAFLRIKTTVLQAARSQSAITKIKNNIAFISNEPALDILGKTTVQNGVPISFLNDPTIDYLSDPIRLDFQSYDFEDASVFYYRYYTYVAIPKEGIVRVYNHEKEYWEAPLTLPVSRFSVINGELYGHSYSLPETYKLFTGTNDNGNAIEAVASFSFQNYGDRANYKSFNHFYVEGYISSNTTLNVGVKFEVDGCGSYQTTQIQGNNPKYVCLASTGGSLGQQALGKRSLAGRGETASEFPPKFRYIKSLSKVDFFEYNATFFSNGLDNNWTLLAFGPNVTLSDHLPVVITN